MTKVLELATFKLASGTKRAGFLREVETTSGVLRTYRGFQERTLYFDEKNDQWFDILLWHTMVEALEAADRILEDERTQAFLGCLDSNAIKLYHGTSIHHKVKDEPA